MEDEGLSSMCTQSGDLVPGPGQRAFPGALLSEPCMSERASADRAVKSVN